MRKTSIRSVLRPKSGVSARSPSTPRQSLGSENVAPPQVEPKVLHKDAPVKVSVPSVRTASAPVPSPKKAVLKFGPCSARAAAQENNASVPSVPSVPQMQANVKRAQPAQKTAPKVIAQKTETVPMKRVAPKMGAAPAVVEVAIPAVPDWMMADDVLETAPLSKVDGPTRWYSRPKRLAAKVITDVVCVHPVLFEEVDEMERASQDAAGSRVKSLVRSAGAVNPVKQFRFNEVVDVVHLPASEYWRKSRESVPDCRYTRKDWHDHLYPISAMADAPPEDVLEYMALEARISEALRNGAGNYEHFTSKLGQCREESIAHFYSFRRFLLEVLHVQSDLCDAATALLPHYPDSYMHLSLPSWLPASSPRGRRAANVHQVASSANGRHAANVHQVTSSASGRRAADVRQVTSSASGRASDVRQVTSSASGRRAADVRQVTSVAVLQMSVK
eukprot:TRINITY_DN1474_c0_g1_i3.p1 TRINITY_DN1474_c0_g1~~TRINITY_DN1474_c0_g1_i3.p1  ORF type:complete len:446 (+),score=92.60 TRINITY_DN1474_c0_g1_i3:149-1486(+)